MKNKTRLFAAVLFSGALLAARAGATVVSYTDPASYAAATTGNTSYAFSGAPAGGEVFTGTSYSLGPINFSAPSSLAIYDDGSYGTPEYLVEAGGGPETLTLTATATAVSFTLGTYYGPDSIDISVNGGTAFTLTEAAGAPSDAFIGFTSTDPITTLTFTDTSEPGGEIDTINFSVDNTVPEPSTWAALLGGVFLLGAALKPRLSTGH